MPQVIHIGRRGKPCTQPPADVPKNPEASFATKVLGYAMANARWAYYGFPVRSEAEQARILETICRPCPLFQPMKRGGKCKHCGCGLNLSKGGKLNMATEACPDTPSRWYATAGPLAQDAPMQDAVPAQPETRRQRRRRERNEARAKAVEERRLSREAKKTRKQRRAERRARKEAERLALGGIMPPPVEPAANDDPLVMYGRDMKPIGHALRGLWQDCAAFYVCGGPSLKALDLSFLKERGVVSLGVNNVAGYAPVKAMTFSDPASKFHHGIFFDPGIIKFVPKPKMSERVRAKMPDGSFQWTAYEVRHCPSVFAYERDGIWHEKEFFSRDKATWGVSKKHVENQGKQTILFSFFLGIRLLHYLGVRRIYLLGVDFKMDAQHHYAFGQYRHQGAIGSNNNSYRVATGMLQGLRPYLDASGLQIFQTNPDSALRVFDHVPLETAIEDCRGLVPQGPLDMARYYEKPKVGANPGEPETDDRGEE